jgi:hypothetical protein
MCLYRTRSQGSPIVLYEYQQTRSGEHPRIFLKGFKASAVIYSIIESAKENALNPYTYLNFLFEKLPNLESKDNETLDQLLSWNGKLQ